jgi:hypothetical protein
VSESAVSLQWHTASEIDNYGFQVWRSASVTDGYTLVSSLIPGAGTTLTAHDYNWTDNSPTPAEPYYRLRQINTDGSVADFEPIQIDLKVATSVAANQVAPKVFQLMQNYPNPFNPSTMVRFSVAQTGPATLVVYNALGQEVATLFNGAAEAGQYYSVRFDAGHMSSGIYFCRLSSGTKNQMMKMALVK